jgi:hypothetical protein
MEQSPCLEGNSYSFSQEIPNILRTPMFHYRFHKSQPLVPTLSQNNSVYDLPFYFSKIHFNITLPSTASSSQVFLSFRCIYKNILCCNIFYKSSQILILVEKLIVDQLQRKM